MSTGEKSSHAGSEGVWAGSCASPPQCHISSILLSCLVSRLAVQESDQKLKVLVLLLLLGSQDSLRKLLTGFNMCFFFPAVALQMASLELQLSSFTRAVTSHINILLCIL